MKLLTNLISDFFERMLFCFASEQTLNRWLRNIITEVGNNNKSMGTLNLANMMAVSSEVLHLLIHLRNKHYQFFGRKSFASMLEAENLRQLLCDPKIPIDMKERFCELILGRDPASQTCIEFFLFFSTQQDIEKKINVCMPLAKYLATEKQNTWPIVFFFQIDSRL